MIELCLPPSALAVSSVKLLHKLYMHRGTLGGESIGHPAPELTPPAQALVEKSLLELPTPPAVLGGTVYTLVKESYDDIPFDLLVIDEATGVDPEIWQSFESQFSPPGHAWIVAYNPTDSGSRVFLEHASAAPCAAPRLTRDAPTPI